MDSSESLHPASKGAPHNQLHRHRSTHRRHIEPLCAGVHWAALLSNRAHARHPMVFCGCHIVGRISFSPPGVRLRFHRSSQNGPPTKDTLRIFYFFSSLRQELPRGCPPCQRLYIYVSDYNYTILLRSTTLPPPARRRGSLGACLWIPPTYIY